MTRVDIISGFLGAGKTTLIKKLLAEALKGQKVVLIENEFGEIGIDGGFLKEAGIQITEMNSGCICCSLVGDFGEALEKVYEQYSPDRIIIEPSGVGKLSDVAAAVERVHQKNPELVLGSLTTVSDAHKGKVYMKNFGEFYNNQIENAGAIILSRTGDMKQEKIEEIVALLREKNPNAAIVTTDWTQITGELLLSVMDKSESLQSFLADDDDDDDDEECCCGHHHHHDDEHECCCGHHHDHEHEHEHHHHHHHGHDADEVFTSWGRETAKKYSRETLESILNELANTEKYGIILRSKGIIPAEDGSWFHFDLVPGEFEVRTGTADYTGRLCVIGSNLNEEALETLFGL